MAKILKQGGRDFRGNPSRVDPYELFTDFSREAAGIRPQKLNFDMRRLDPDRFSALYHFHRYAEELFVMMSGSAMLRTPDGLHTLESGDIAFFEAGSGGVHQLYNHTGEPCTYLDIRTFDGVDVCEYPDSDKVLIIPSMETFRRNSQVDYFDGEANIRRIWSELGLHTGE